MTRRRLSAIASLALGLALAAQAPARGQGAPGLSREDGAAIRTVISRQLDAFRRDDGAEAFSYASPGIRGLFGTPEKFMEMVRRGYPAVYRPRSAAFEGVFFLEGRPVQKLRVVGPEGATFMALYVMERQPDGGWKIDGCHLVVPKGEAL